MTPKERRACGDVRRAIESIGLIGILEVLREHCDEKARASAPAFVQTCYGKIEEKLSETQCEISGNEVQ
jgi:hypothetical protein